MVKNPGATARSGAIKPLNAPEAIEVQVDAEGLPAAMRLPVLAAQSLRPGGSGRQGPRGEKRRFNRFDTRPGPKSPLPLRERACKAGVRGSTDDPGAVDATPVNVASVDDGWKVVDEWWRGADQMIVRMYYALVLGNGQRVTVFQDLANGGWYRQAG